MLLKPLSIKSSIRAVIIMIGLLGVISVFISIHRYQDLFFEEQRLSHSELIKLDTTEKLLHYTNNVFDLGLTMQSQPEFRSAFTSNDKQRLNELINEQFRQYFVTTGLVDLKKIALFDTKLSLITESDYITSIPANEGICNKALDLAKKREGIERFKSIDTVCRYRDSVHHTVIIPIGGLKLVGYAALSSNPIGALHLIPHSLGMPIEIKYFNRESAYHSDTWPLDLDKFLISEYQHYNSEQELLFSIYAASDITRLTKLLNQTSTFILIAGLILTLLFIIVTMTILRHNIIKPLQRLKNHLRHIHHDQEVLQKDLILTGCLELNEVAKEFNYMSGKLSALQQELKSMAFTDELTKVSNRASFYQQLEQQIKLCERQGEHFTLFMIDLDRFKIVNDTLGHHAGDELLIQVTERLKKRLRTSDVLARLGGDEFAILLPTLTNENDAQLLANSLIDEINKPYIIEQQSVSISMSIGIAIYPETATNSDELVRCADGSMYYSKRNHLGVYICKHVCKEDEKCKLME